MLEGLRSLLGFGAIYREPSAGRDSASMGWAPIILLVSAVNLLIISIADNLSREGREVAPAIYWAGLVAFLVPGIIRLCQSKVSRQERILLVLILAAGLFLIKYFKSPLYFDGHDEFIHWSTLNDILARHQLFTINALLPVSPLFPGLELVTAAMMQLTGLDVFSCAIILLIVLRLLLALGLYLVFENITGSARIASLASIVYMGNSNYIRFQASFSYETLAIQFLIALLLIEARNARTSQNQWFTSLCLTVPLMTAVAMTHHLTSWIALAFVATGGLIRIVKSDSKAETFGIGATIVAALACCIGWIIFIGNPTSNYIGPMLDRAAAEIQGFFTGQSGARKLFVAEDGEKAPFLISATGIASVALVSLFLAIGFFRTLALPPADQSAGPKKGLAFSLGMRGNGWAILLTIITLAFPAATLMRLTSGGWEIANRASAFLFIGISLVVSVGIAGFWLHARPSVFRSVAAGSILSLIVIGGIVTGGPPDLLPTPYVASADGRSIERLGVETASWTKETLGEGWRFASDRVNRLLLSTYGMQRVITEIQDRVEIGGIFFNSSLSDDDNWVLRDAAIDFLLVDLRLQTSLPKFGMYFEAGEDRALHDTPPRQENLTKFNTMPAIGRPYDNGFIIIYDVRRLRQNDL